MDDILTSLYGSHNDAAQRGVLLAAEKIASVYKDEGVAVFEQWLEQVPQDAIFDVENNPQKTAEEADPALMAKIAEAELFGRVAFHAFRAEEDRMAKMAEHVADRVYAAFVADCTESEGAAAPAAAAQGTK